MTLINDSFYMEVCNLRNCREYLKPWRHENLYAIKREVARLSIRHNKWARVVH